MSGHKNSGAVWRRRSRQVVDVFSKEMRGRIMSRIHSGDTKPERLVRSMVHGLGYRFRLHQNRLPGTPDLVFPRLHSVIFVHGCFWHGHPGCARAGRPATNVIFWKRKIRRNQLRDRSCSRLLRKAGWRVCVVWQCELRNEAGVRKRLAKFLRAASKRKARV